MVSPLRLLNPTGRDPISIHGVPGIEPMLLSQELKSPPPPHTNETFKINDYTFTLFDLLTFSPILFVYWAQACWCLAVIRLFRSSIQPSELYRVTMEVGLPPLASIPPRRRNVSPSLMRQEYLVKFIFFKCSFVFT